MFHLAYLQKNDANNMTKMLKSQYNIVFKIPKSVVINEAALKKTVCSKFNLF